MVAIASTDILAPEFFNPDTGRLDAARIASELRVPIATIASAVGRHPAGVRKRPDANSLQHRLREIYEIWCASLEKFNGDRITARMFLNAPNGLIERNSPMELIKAGDTEPLLALFEVKRSKMPNEIALISRAQRSYINE
jgi:hypothetical protein